MKKIVIALLFTLSALSVSSAQKLADEPSDDAVVIGSFWNNWYVQAGLDMTLQNPYKHDFSKVFPKGKTFGLNVAAGKWFSPELGVRMRLNWENGFPLFENGHLEWVAPAGRNGINMDKGGYVATYFDVQLSLSNIIMGYDESREWNVVVFPRAGLASNLAINSGSPMVGVGAGGTYRIKERLSLYADVAYQVITSEFFGDVSGTGMSVSTGCNGFLDFHVGVQWDLGKSKGKFRRFSSYKSDK